MIRFTIPGEVIPQGRPRFARTRTGVRTYDPARSREYKSFVQWSTFQLWPAEPLDGPLSVRIVEYRAIPASWSKKRRAEALAGVIRPTGNKITYGDYGLVATEPGWITSNQIEATRIAMN